jgi:tellurite resistance protein TehA-like permease
MANAAPRNNRLMPWYIGIVVILAAVIWVGYQMWASSCPAPTFIQIGVLTVIPVVYLALMYLTFVSQK